MSDKPLYIFDLDGTLALIEHRRHVLDDHENSMRWQTFYAMCDRDAPNEAVISTMERLRLTSDIYVFSGRSAEVRGKTVAWLTKHTSFLTHDLDSALVMRDEGDYTPDDVLKKQWFDGMLTEDKQRLVATFDDRDRVVKMWRDSGVTCFQVAPGEF